MHLFSQRDRRLVESLVYDGNAEPSYEQLKDCLIWPDELPENITPDGYEVLSNLWIARSLFHRGRSFDSYPLDSTYIKKSWELAHQLNLKWPGLHPSRISLACAKYYGGGYVD